MLGAFADERAIERLDGQLARTGVMEGATMAGTFDALRANDLIFSYVVSNWLMGQDPPAFDILAWNADSTRLPAAMHSFYLRSLYAEASLGPAGLTTGNPGVLSEPGCDREADPSSRTTRAPWEHLPCPP